MRLIEIVLLTLITTAVMTPAFAQSSEDPVSRGYFSERERGEPFVSVPQTMQADVNNRGAPNVTIIVDPTRDDARQDDTRRAPSNAPRPRR